MEKRSIKIWGFSFVINIAIAFLAIFVFGTDLCLEDDSTMSYMFYGIITNASSRAFYTNVVLGWICKHLFLWFPEINWQTIIYYCGLIFSGTISFYYILKHRSKAVSILWLMFEIVFFHDVYVSLTFSVVAAFIACHGYLTLFLSVQENERNVFSYVMSGLILLLSSMIRIDSFIGVSGFAFFVWLIFVIVKIIRCEKSDILIRYVYPFAAVLGVCFLFYGADRMNYMKGDWKAYHDIEEARGIVTDHRNSVFLQDMDAIEKIGVNKSQAYAILDWRSNDPEILNIELVKKMGETTKDYNYFTSPYVWKAFLGQWGEIFTTTLEIYFSLMVYIFLLISSKKKHILGLMIVPFLAELFYFAYIGRMYGGMAPERCIYVVLMGFSMGSIALYDAMKNEKNMGEPLSAVLMFLIAASVVIAQPAKDFSINGLGLVDTDELQDRFQFLGRGEKVYVGETAVAQDVAKEYGAWQTPEAGFMSRYIDMGNWLTTHPMQNEHQISLGCENPYRSLFENENVYFIRKEPVEDLVLEYLKENYDDRIEKEYVKEKGGYKVFKYHIE